MPFYEGDSMSFSVGVGKSNFSDIRQSNNNYVDKTELIYDPVHNADNMVTQFTRARCFGKTSLNEIDRGKNLIWMLTVMRQLSIL